MLKSLVVATFTLSLALPVMAQTREVTVGKTPGVVGAAQTVQVSATITAIDAASRAITVKGPQGREVTFIAGPEVKNFSQLKVGDQVDAQYSESLVVELKKGGGMAVGATEQSAMASAKQGGNPAGMGGRQVTVVGDVINLDPATQTVTVRGKERTLDLKVRDPDQFKLMAKGDQIQATYTEAVGVAVVPKKK